MSDATRPATGDGGMCEDAHRDGDGSDWISTTTDATTPTLSQMIVEVVGYFVVIELSSQLLN